MLTIANRIQNIGNQSYMWWNHVQLCTMMQNPIMRLPI